MLVMMMAIISPLDFGANNYINHHPPQVVQLFTTP